MFIMFLIGVRSLQGNYRRLSIVEVLKGEIETALKLFKVVLEIIIEKEY